MSLFHKHTKYGKVKVSTLIQERELKNLDEFLLKEFDDVSYKGKTKDGTSVQFESINELLSYPNFSARQLLELEISGAKKDERSINIEFESERGFIVPESINYYLSYNDQNWGFKFEDDLRNELKDFIPYYNFLTYLNYTFGLPILLFISLILYMTLDYFLKEAGLWGFTDIDYSIKSESSSSSFPGLAWGILLFGLTYLMNLGRDYLFPILFIAIGKQVKEYNKRKTISYVVFGVVMLGVIINLISELLVKGI